MDKKTEHEYYRLAKHFLETHLSGVGTKEDIQQQLLRVANDHRKDYWRKIRRALVFSFETMGKYDVANLIEQTQYPAIEQKIKKRRVKKVTADEHRKLQQHCVNKNDLSLCGALELTQLFACRPSELFSIELTSKTSVSIIGSKKTENGERGLDREIHFEGKYTQAVAWCIKNLQEELSLDKDSSKAIKRLQRRLATATKKLWPKRKSHITFYSYRHQLGSNYKGSDDISRLELAAIMGHQSVNSADKYGDSRSAQGGHRLQASKDSINSVRVRQLRNPHYQKMLRDLGSKKPPLRL